MIQEQQQLERLQAEEDSRLAKAKANLDLGEVAGAQRAAADAEAIRNAQIQSGVGAIAQAGLGYMADQPLYKRIAKMNKLFDEGHEIVYWTARGMKTFKNDPMKCYVELYQLTKRQLDDWGVKYTDLILGKPQYDLFICDKAVSDKEFFKD